MTVIEELLAKEVIRAKLFPRFGGAPGPEAPSYGLEDWLKESNYE